MPLINAIKGTTFFALALTSMLSFALPDDRDQPIEIEADAAKQDQNKGITTYTGNVKMDQGSIRIIATGSPAHFQQRPALNKEVIIARGNNLKYEVVKDKLTITENAQVEQDGSIVTGDIINYDIHLALVEAGSRESTNSRVKMILQPQKKATETQD